MAAFRGIDSVRLVLGIFFILKVIRQLVRAVGHSVLVYSGINLVVYTTIFSLPSNFIQVLGSQEPQALSQSQELNSD